MGDEQRRTSTARCVDSMTRSQRAHIVMSRGLRCVAMAASQSGDNDSSWMESTMSKSKTWAPALLAAAFAVAGAQAQESWNFKAYPKDPSGRYDKAKFFTATITLKNEKDGKGTFLMITPAGRPDPCISGRDLPAEVERSAETVTITVLPTLAGCQSNRFVIKTDGSGGVRVVRRGEEWVPDGLDHDLTRKK